jgi:hypothetical protein
MGAHRRGDTSPLASESKRWAAFQTEELNVKLIALGVVAVLGTNFGVEESAYATAKSAAAQSTSVDSISSCRVESRAEYCQLWVRLKDGIIEAQCHTSEGCPYTHPTCAWSEISIDTTDYFACVCADGFGGLAYPDGVQCLGRTREIAPGLYAFTCYKLNCPGDCDPIEIQDYWFPLCVCI